MRIDAVSSDMMQFYSETTQTKGAYYEQGDNG